MLALTLPEEEIKGFMNKLLREETFDVFDVKSANIDSFARFDIAATEERISWALIRPHVFYIIKSGQKPTFMKIILSMNQSEAETAFPDAKALFLNIIFENDVITITTGVAAKSFTMDKTMERAWDDYSRKTLISNGINFKES